MQTRRTTETKRLDRETPRVLLPTGECRPRRIPVRLLFPADRVRTSVSIKGLIDDGLARLMAEWIAATLRTSGAEAITVAEHALQNQLKKKKRKNNYVL